MRRVLPRRPETAVVGSPSRGHIEALAVSRNQRSITDHYGASARRWPRTSGSVRSLARRGWSIDNSVRCRSLRLSIVWRLSSCVVLVSSRCRLWRCARLGLTAQRP
jgi:hypothetical protein